MERQLLIAADDARLGEYRGGIYNPGAVVLNDGIFLLARNERFTELQRKQSSRLVPGTCRPMGLYLSRRLTIERCRPLVLDESLQEGRVEDFRLFFDRGALQASFSRVLPSNTIEHQTSAVDESNLRLGPLCRPLVDFFLQRTEKNWCYFEHDGGLFLLYSFQPFRLLRRVESQPFRFATVSHALLSMGGMPCNSRPAERISLSTNPIDFDNGHFLLFVHWRDESGNYRHYGVLLDKHTLQPVCIARQSLFAGGGAQGLHPHVVYLMSVVRCGGDFLFFLGEGDSHISYARLSEAQLRGYLLDSVAIDCRPNHDFWIAGEYRYEHCGRFVREVVLNRDGSIFPGGPHDSHWRLEWAAGRLELCIVGGGRVSCRMRSGARGWSGRWRWGGRPLARLTRRSGEQRCASPGLFTGPHY